MRKLDLQSTWLQPTFCTLYTKKCSLKHHGSIATFSFNITCGPREGKEYSMSSDAQGWEIHRRNQVNPFEGI